LNKVILISGGQLTTLRIAPQPLMTATTARPAYDTGHAPQEPEPTHTFDADSDILESGKNPALPPNHPINALSPTRKWLILVTLSYAGLLGNFA